MSTDLQQHRPTDADLECAWGTERREETLERLLKAAQHGPKPSDTVRRKVLARRAVLLGSAAAVAYGFTLLGPESTTPRAEALDRLIRSAGRSSAATISPSEYAYLVVEQDQRDPGIGQLRSTLESWTDIEGQIWRRDIVNGKVRYLMFRTPNDAPLAPTPRSVAALPTTAGSLRRFLERHTSGSTSRNEAIFTAVGDLARTGFVPSAQRAALIEVAGSLPQVTTTESGRHTLLTFRDAATRPGVEQTLVFDTATSALREERSSAPGSAFSFVARTVIADVRGFVPAEVLSRAVPQP